MNFRRQRLEEVSVNLTPLIDVVFLLLIFFMVSTTFTRETQLSIDLPEAVSICLLLKRQSWFKSKRKVKRKKQGQDSHLLD